MGKVRMGVKVEIKHNIEYNTNTEDLDEYNEDRSIPS